MSTSETIVQVRRDPFGRATLMRGTLPKEYRIECSWCGQPSRFIYWWEQDGLRTHKYEGREQFCSIGCYDAYAS